jgi:hypothetical protein
LASATTTSGRPGVGRKLLGLLLLSSTLGCSQGWYSCPEGLTQRVLPPENLDLLEGLSPTKTPAQEAAKDARGGRPGEDGSASKAAPDVLPPLRKPTLPEPPPPAQTAEGAAPGGVPCRPLTLPEAIALAFQLQPRLRSALESIEQAARRQDIANAAFLPVATTGYHVGGFHLDVGGEGLPLGPAGQQLARAFTFVPFTGSLPIGLNVNTGYEVAELKVQWLIWDFGRRLGRSNQAGLALDIARLQADRARQTVANEVAVAYY